MASPAASLGIVVGLQREVRAIRRLLGDGVRIACAGADSNRAEAAALRLAEEGAAVLISIGYAGGLDPDVSSGSVILADEVVAEGGERYRVAPAWVGAVRQRLSGISRVHVGPLAGSNAALIDSDAKRALWLRTQCLAVDMESHAVARVAARFRLPFGVVRVVVDDAATAIPSWLTAAVTASGETDWNRLLRGIARRPREIPILVRLACQERHASRVLCGVVARLRGGVGHESRIP